MTSSEARWLRAALWAAQAVVVVAFEVTGVLKSCFPAADLATAAPWLTAPAGVLPVVGGLEALGAVLLFLPSTLRILPAVAPLSAAALSAVALLGAAMPASGAGAAGPALNLALAALAAFVAWGRLQAAPVEEFRFDAARTPPETVEPVEAEHPRTRPRPQQPLGPWATA